MNKWECDSPGCKCTAIGIGSSIGLRAIGWCAIPGLPPKLFCPEHHPEGFIYAETFARLSQAALAKDDERERMIHVLKQFLYEVDNEKTD